MWEHLAASKVNRRYGHHHGLCPPAVMWQPTDAVRSKNMVMVNIDATNHRPVLNETVSIIECGLPAVIENALHLRYRLSSGHLATANYSV